MGEDPHLVDERTLIGTATLPDWIMGGELTSRLLVQEKQNGNILFMRPLYNDDTRTSDRRYELTHGEDNEKIEIVRKEIASLRFLATLKHPFVEETLPANTAGKIDLLHRQKEKLR